MAEPAEESEEFPVYEPIESITSVKVAVRARPLLAKERSEKARVCVSLDETNMVRCAPDTPSTKAAGKYCCMI